LPAAHSQVPVPRAALLALGNRDVRPVGLAALDDTNELAQVLASPFEVSYVAAIGLDLVPEKFKCGRYEPGGRLPGAPNNQGLTEM
jgi:hypothetical protein